MAEAEVELDLGRALGQDAVADADDLELLLIALGDTDDHVVDQCARQAVKGLAATLVVRALDRERAIVGLADRDGLRDGVGELALGALDADVLAFDRDLDAGRDGDGILADA